MEKKIAEIFSFFTSFVMWKNVKEIYDNQKIASLVFQLKRDVLGLQLEGKYLSNILVNYGI